MPFRPFLVKVLGFQRTTEQDLQDIPDSYQSYRRRSNIEFTGLYVVAQHTWIAFPLVSYTVADLGTVMLPLQWETEYPNPVESRITWKGALIRYPAARKIEGNYAPMILA